MTMCGTSANTLLQSTVQPHLLGTAVSLYMLAMRGGLSLGALLTGLAVELLGVQGALLIDGCAAVAIQLCLAWYWQRSSPPQALPTATTL
jgi:predicted MFS family arabinose efflux permease